MGFSDTIQRHGWDGTLRLAWVMASGVLLAGAWMLRNSADPWLYRLRRKRRRPAAVCHSFAELEKLRRAGAL